MTSSVFKSSRSRSRRFLELIAEHEDVLIVMHDNPDPDAIATGWGLYVLVQERLGVAVRLVAGGAIVRAENRHMVDLLEPPIELVDSLQVSEGTAAVLVDCSYGTTNQLLTRHNIKPLAVIDHHEPPSHTSEIRLPFRDVRHNVAASATIAASYLHEQDVDPGAKLATAMIYAIRTETAGCETYHSRLDRSILTWLTSQAEPALLAEIENAPLSRSYFADLLLAIQNTFLYGDTALCLLPRAEGVEIVGEVADLLIRCRGVERVLCGAIVGKDMFLSARTSDAVRNANATELLQQTVGTLGSAGGHSHRAGGKIVGVARNGQITETMENELRFRWLRVCNVDRQRGTRLVPRREIVENL
jgi:nanoRNase/pAp phosphatase (c-di-AMP/oligoRNAs hydrolase)